MLVSKKHKKLILNLKNPERVLTVIPTARTLEYKGRQFVAVPHRLDEVKVLKNLGFDAPPPMRFYYDWPGRYTPYEHQRVTSEFMTMNPRAYVLNGMGSGKSMSTLWAFDYLKKLGMANKLLILAPLSTLERAWGDEIFRNFAHLTFAVLHGDIKKRKALLAEDFDIYIINHDGIKFGGMADALVAKEGLDVVCIDELASFRTSNTDRWRAMNRIVENKTWVWGLTGTPTPNGPTDAWAQVRLITPSKVTKYFTAFRDQVMRPISKFKWVPREGAMDMVSRIMQPAVRFAREDCIDLPPTTYVTRQCELTDEQKSAYNTMLTKLKLDYEGGQITAVNEAVKLSKLIQICSGTAYSQDGEIVIPSKHRLELTKEIIEEAEGKVIVFVPFTGALHHVAEALREDYAVEVIHGGVSKSERDRIFGAFQSPGGPTVLVAIAAAMSHGLTLTAANTIVWFAPITSNEIYQQACARIIRPGQKRNTLIVQVESTPLERRMYQRLAGKEAMQGLLLSLLKEA